MKKGIIQALVIPIIFTIVLISIMFISIKYNIVKAVDVEFNADNSQSVLQTLLTSTASESNSGREQSMMEILGENILGTGGHSFDETLPEHLARYTSATCNDGSCELSDIGLLLTTRMNQLVFTTCYRIQIDDFDFGGSSFKAEEAKEITGKDNCDLAYPSTTIIPLPYNKEKLSTQVRLMIE